MMGQFSSVKPMSLLVRGYTRMALAEFLLAKHWKGLL